MGELVQGRRPLGRCSRARAVGLDCHAKRDAVRGGYRNYGHGWPAPTQTPAQSFGVLGGQRQTPFWQTRLPGQCSSPQQAWQTPLQSRRLAGQTHILSPEQILPPVHSSLPQHCSTKMQRPSAHSRLLGGQTQARSGQILPRGQSAAMQHWSGEMQ